SLPWNSHLGVGQIYVTGAWVARAFGGTIIDGLRLMGAIYFAVAAALIFDTCLHLCGAILLAALLTAAWMTAWVNLHYHLILEDNFLFLAPAAALLRVCVLRAGAFDRRDALAAGAFGLLGYLGSVSALPYLAPAVLTSIYGGESGRSWKRRALDAA